jgi:trk system potassium uptake protein TrkA
MFILIAGGALTSAQLANRLLSQGHRVLVVESDPQALARIHRELPTDSIYEGNPAHPMALEQAGIREADVLVTLTGHDATNLVLCYAAQHRYGVKRTIAEINDPRNGWLFDEKFGVNVALDSTEIWRT